MGQWGKFIYCTTVLITGEENKENLARHAKQTFREMRTANTGGIDGLHIDW